VTKRVYLDWNATAPLRPEAREAMLSAMDVVGNPSSVHAEGRAAKAIVEKARGQVARLVGCDPSEVVFTSGATEAAMMVSAAHYARRIVGATEHDAVYKQLGSTPAESVIQPVDRSGLIDIAALKSVVEADKMKTLVALQSANSETGIIQSSQEISSVVRLSQAAHFADITQSVGKIHRREQFDFNWAQMRPAFASLAAHKIGGPKGVGALILRDDVKLEPIIQGGGQESGRRSGTENLTGIAGFGAAAKACLFDFDVEAWEKVKSLRNDLEMVLSDAVPQLLICGREVERLPNTSCFAIPGWKGETQVMQMDLAGYAISAGSACSSGKVNKASRVLLAMGYDEETASSAIRVSIGPTTTEAEVMAFADTWIEHYCRRKSRAA
jgi:cysteine desulfurase